MTPEFDLVRAAAAAAATGWNQQLDDVTRGRGPIDWERARFLAARLRVIPLWWAAVRSAPTGLVPEPALVGVRADFEAGAARSLQVTGALLEVLESLESWGVEAIAYKGAVLAHRLYGNVTMRQFKDNDLFVRPADLEGARMALTAIGYGDLHRASPAGRSVMRRAGHELTMTRGEDVVELHWGVAPRQFAFATDVAGLFARARRTDLDGRSVRYPAPEDELLLMCVHGAKDGWKWLDNVAAVGRLVTTSPDLDWAAVVEPAEHRGATRMLLLGLALAMDLLDVTLPGHLTDRMRRDSHLTKLRAATAAVMAEGAAVDLSPGGLRQARFHLAVRERARDRLEYCWRGALTPNVRDCQVVALPRPLGALYYPLHVGRLIARYSPRPWAG